MKLSNEISQGKQFNVTLVLFHEISKEIFYTDPS